MKNMRILIITFISNILFGTVSIFWTNGFLAFLFADSYVGPISVNIFAWSMIIGLIGAFIVVNYFCTKYCRIHKTGGFYMYLLNTFIMLLGFIIPWVLFFVFIVDVL